MNDGSNVYYYAHDHLYSPAALLNSSGTVVERYEYDAYGQPYVLYADFTDDADGLSDYGNPYMFTGRRVDFLDNANLVLQYSRFRYYDYYTGRWLSHDPFGEGLVPSMQYVDGSNLYEYVISSPVCLLDPMGLKLEPTVKEETLEGTIRDPGDSGFVMDYTISIKYGCHGFMNCIPYFHGPKVEKTNLRNWPDWYKPSGPGKWWIVIIKYMKHSVTTSTFPTVMSVSRCPKGMKGSTLVVRIDVTHEGNLAWYWRGGDEIEWLPGESFTFGSSSEAVIIDCCHKCCK